MSDLKKLLFFIILLPGMGLISIAQTPETDIIITVKNQLGEVVADAELTLSRSDQKIKLIKTNKQGAAHFSKLAAGEYQISVAAVGFNDYKSESIVVKTGEVRKMEIVLEIASVKSDVEVSGSDEADTENYGATKVLTDRQIESLPDDPDQLEKVLKQMAGDSVTGEELPVSVNGIPGGKIPPKQAIQQIRINQNIFSAQYEGPYGGGIEIFTRSGIPKFTGGGYFGFADSRFNAADPYIGKRVPFQSRSYNIYLQGPINKRTSFFLNTRHADSDSSAVINATVLDASLLPVAFQQTFASPTRGDGIYFVLNSDPTKKHKISLNYNMNLANARGQNVGNFSLPSRENKSNSQYQNLQMSETYLANENVVNQIRLGIFYTANKSFGGSNEAALNVQDAFFGGGSQTDSSNKDLRFDISDDVTWQMGKYGLGFGWRIRGQHIKQVSRSNFGGTYTFSGGVAPVLDANNNPVRDGSGNIVTAQINSLESYRRTLLLSRAGFSPAQIRNLGGGANQFAISGGNPEVTATQYDYGFYLQNSYKVSETVAASFGVRYENQTNIDSRFNFSPRLGLIWSPKSKPKQKTLYTLPRISAGVGMFYSRFALSNFLSVLQANDADRSQYLITTGDILNFYPTVPTVGLLQQFALPKTRRFIDSGLQTPYQMLFNVNVSKKMPKGFNLNFGFTEIKNTRQALTRNINAPLAGTFNTLNSAPAIYPMGLAGNIYQTYSTGKGESTRYSANLNFPNAQKYYAGIFYNFSKSKNNVVGGSGSPFNPYDFSNEYGPSSYDGVQSLGGYFWHSLPYGFDISGNFSLASGSRFDIITGRDTNGDGFYNERPAFAADPNKAGVVSTEYGLLDPNPSAGETIIPRNLAHGPGSFSADGRIGKTFKFGEDKKNKKPAKKTLGFSMSVSNVFNIISKGNPVGNMSSPNFLQSLSGGGFSTIIISNGINLGGQQSFAGRSMSFTLSFGFQ